MTRELVLAPGNEIAVPTTLRIPDEQSEVSDLLAGASSLLTATHWARAALVCALVGRSQGPGRPEMHEKSCITVRELAAQGIAGLRTQDSIRKYRDRWLDLRRGVPELGATVDLADLPCWRCRSEPCRCETDTVPADTADGFVGNPVLDLLHALSPTGKGSVYVTIALQKIIADESWRNYHRWNGEHAGYASFSEFVTKEVKVDPEVIRYFLSQSPPDLIAFDKAMSEASTPDADPPRPPVGNVVGTAGKRYAVPKSKPRRRRGPTGGRTPSSSWARPSSGSAGSTTTTASAAPPEPQHRIPPHGDPRAAKASRRDRGRWWRCVRSSTATPSRARRTPVPRTVGGWFKRSRWSAYRANMHNGWWLRQEHLADVLAELEADGRHVWLHRRTAPPHRPRASPPDDEAVVA